MVRIPVVEEKLIDFSFVPSLECNLECPFCMYSAGPDNLASLGLGPTREFVATVDWELISSWGFYGGEPSINLPLYQMFIDLIPPQVPRFVITNGAWSTDYQACAEFLRFCSENRLFIVVSGTPSHRLYQDRKVLESLAEDTDVIRLKGDDEIHPMGRAAKPDWACTQKCLWYDVPTRFSIFPGGNIRFQNCDGVYPVVQTYHEPFRGILERACMAIRHCKGLRGTGV